MAYAQGHPVRATCLHGALATLCEELGSRRVMEDPEYREIVVKLHEVQSEEVFAAAFTTGSTMTLQEAVDKALKAFL